MGQSCILRVMVETFPKIQQDDNPQISEAYGIPSRVSKKESTYRHNKGKLENQSDEVLEAACDWEADCLLKIRAEVTPK